MDAARALPMLVGVKPASAQRRPQHRHPGGGRLATPAFACLVAACGGGGDGHGDSGGGEVPGIGDPPAVVCPGVDATTLRAVRVSPQGSDSGLCGLSNFSVPPCKSIRQALALAYDLSYPALLLQHGLYQTNESIDLKFDQRTGISLYGSCRFGGEPDRKYRTVIQVSRSPGQPAILANGANATVSGVVVVASDETVGGAASVAMTAVNANVTLRGSVLVAGDGAPGASRPALPSATAVGTARDICYRPGGAASALTWGQVDLGSAVWVGGIGGAGAGSDDTGPGGSGGQQGGASIGLLLANSATLSTVEGEFNRILAGHGGAGGTGQAGPSFGLGGGANSGGAGGNGGPSIGAASINAAALQGGSTYVFANAAGAPGAGGAAGVDPGQCQADPGDPGVAGASAAIHQFSIPATLPPGESLAGGQSLYSPDLQSRLTLGGDNALCLTSAGRTLWCSATRQSGQVIRQAIMQTDGNFCLYDAAGLYLPVCSGSAGHPGARLTVLDSAQAQVVDPAGPVLWSVP